MTKRKCRRAIACMVVWAWGCGGGSTEPSTSTPPQEELLEVYEVVPLGPSPRDPIWVVTSEGSVEPIVLDESGKRMEMEPVLASRSEVVAWRSADEDGFVPGAYVVSGFNHQGVTPMAWPWTVGSYGVDPAFDPQSVAGVTYEALLEPDDVILWSVGSVLWAASKSEAAEPGVWLEIEEVAPGGEVIFRVLATIEQSPVCQVLRGKGTLSDQGLLRFEMGPMDVDAGGAVPQSIQTLMLEVAFSPDGMEAAGGSLRAEMDSVALSELVTDPPVPDFLCPFSPCFPCEAPSGQCIEGRADAIDFVATDERFEDVPACGLDLENVADIDFEIPTLSCDVDLGLSLPDVVCGCTSGTLGGPPLGLLAVVVLLRRRRPSGLGGVLSQRSPQ